MIVVEGACAGIVPRGKATLIVSEGLSLGKGFWGGCEESPESVEQSGG